MHHLETLISAIPPAVFAAGGTLSSLAPAFAALSDNSAASPAMPFLYPDGIPSGVPPPSLHVFPLTNPSTHFTREPTVLDERHQSPHQSFSSFGTNNLHRGTGTNPDSLAEDTERMSLTA